MSTEVTDGPSTSDSSVSQEKAEAKLKAGNLLAQGKRNLICGEVPAAVQLFQEACQTLSSVFGEIANECAEAYFQYGCALLDLARMEGDVLGNALEGVDVEAEDDAPPNQEQFETADKITETERVELRKQVVEAMSEEEIAKQATLHGKSDGTKDKEKPDGKEEAKDDNKGEKEESGKDSKDEVVKEEEKEDAGKEDLKRKARSERKRDGAMCGVISLGEGVTATALAERKRKDEEEFRKTLEAEMKNKEKGDSSEEEKEDSKNEEKADSKKDDLKNEKGDSNKEDKDGSNKEKEPMEEDASEKTESMGKEETQDKENISNNEKEDKVAKGKESDQKKTGVLEESAKNTPENEMVTDKEERTEVLEKSAKTTSKDKTVTDKEKKTKDEKDAEMEGIESEKSGEELKDADKMDEADGVPEDQEEGKPAEEGEVATEEDEEEEGEEEEGEEGGDDQNEEGGDAEAESQEDERKEGEENADDVSNLQLAWEVLDLSKVIYSRDDSREAKLKTAEISLKLGEVSMESEQCERAVEELDNCLALRKELLEPCDRAIAEVYYQLGMAKMMASEFSPAIDSFKSAITCLEKKIEDLKEIVKQKPPKDENVAESSDSLEPAEKAEKEISDIEMLIPDIKNKITDAEDELKTKEGLKSSIKESLMSAFGDTGSTETGFGSTSSKSDSPVKSTEEKKTADISHLIRKKRKPDDDKADEDVESKKAKQENGTGDAPLLNGCSEGEKATETMEAT